MSRLVMPAPVRQPRPAPEKPQDVYAHVDARDVTCVAAKLDPAHVCSGRLERHHAGLSIGMRRKTDRLHVCLLCDGANQGAWARVHDDAVLAYIADEEAR